MSTGWEKPFRDNQTDLHWAALSGAVRQIEALLEKGADIDATNNFGRTPLHVAKDVETVAALLAYNADPFVQDCHGHIPLEFKIFKRRPPYNEDMMRILFSYGQKIQFKVLVKLGEADSVLFNEVVRLGEVVEDVIPWSMSDLENLLRLKSACAEVLLKQYEPLLEKSLVSIIKERRSRARHVSRNTFLNLQTLSTFLENRVGIFVTELIFFNWDVFESLIFDHRRLKVVTDEPTARSVILLLLSYGMELRETNFATVYRAYGYCELLNIMLYMSFNQECDVKKSLMPALLYDVNIKLDDFLTDPASFVEHTHAAVLDFFAGQRLKKVLLEKSRLEVGAATRIAAHPEISSLVELARNAFREHFIQTFSVKNCKQFYVLLDRLPICNEHNKIISYKRKLYN